MEENIAPDGAQAAAIQAPTMSFFQRLSGIYTTPQKTFEDIGRKPSWVGMFVIIAILALLMINLLPYRMGPDIYKEKAREAIPSFAASRMTPEQMDQAMEQSLSPTRRITTMVLTPVMQLVVFMIVAGAFLLVFVILGGQLTFKKSLAVTMWGLVPPGIVSSILTIIIMFVKDPSSLEIDPSGILASNLGMLVSRKEHPALASLLGSIDIFSFWAICMLTIGFAAVSEGKLTRGKAMAGVVVLWAIYVLGKVGWYSIF